jgi:hypothetical protein
VAKVTNEHWWGCYAKSASDAQHEDGSIAGIVVKESADLARGTSLKWTGEGATSATTSATTSTSTASFDLALGGTSSPTNVSSGVFGNEFVEAPAMFKRKGLYYALFGNCCCFCGHGSGIGVYTATHPLGPYTYHDNVGCTANTTLTPGCGCGMNHNTKEGKCDNYGKSLTKAQQNFVIQIAQADGSKQFVWTGDMWQSAKDGIKAHDLQYWSVLDFQPVNGIDLPVQFKWQDVIQISV